MNFAIEVPGEAVPLNLQDLCQALLAGNGHNHSQRQSASKQLEAWQAHAANYYASLQTVFLDRSLPYEVRFLAIILLKNGIDKNWRAAASIKGSLPAQEKALIRSRLFQGTVDEADATLALHNALAAAKIVRIDCLQEWPSALSDLMGLLRQVRDGGGASGGEQQQQQQLNGALLLMLRVVKELSTARLRRSQTALQHVAEELFYLLGEIYTAYTGQWLEFLSHGGAGAGTGTSSSSNDESAVLRAMHISLTALKTLRHLMTSGFEYPHRSKAVQEFWTLTQTQFDRFFGYVRLDGGGAAAIPASCQDLVGRHLIKFTKLHIDMCDLHPASFAVLPNSVALVRAYWGLVASFAEVFTKSGGLRQNASGGGGGGASSNGGGGGSKSKLEGPLQEKLALKGLLLVKSCLHIVSKPLQTFKYRNPEAQQEQARGVQLIKTELFTDAFLLQVVDTIVSKLFLFRQSDLEAWDEDPEEWEAQESESGAAWEWQVRPCAERVFLALLIHNKPLLVPPLLAYFAQAMSEDADLLAKEAVYTAMANAAAAIGRAFDFEVFLTTTLVKDAQVQGGSLAKILRRRVAIVLGAWSFYELPPASSQLVFSLYRHLLTKAEGDDENNDEVVRLTAARQLKNTVNDISFRPALMEPMAADVFGGLVQLLQEADADETKLAVLSTMRVFIERMEAVAAQFSDSVMAALPGIWDAASGDGGGGSGGGSETYMIKQAVLTILATLMMALGAASQPYHGLVLPLLGEALNPASEVHPFLFDEAVELWASVMNQSSAASVAAGPQLVELLPLAVPVLEYDSQLVPTVVQIVNAYIVLAPEAALSERFRRGVLGGLAAAMEATKKWEQVKAAAASVQNMVQAAHRLGGRAGVSAVVQDMLELGLLGRMLERLHGAWEAHQSTGPKARTSPISTTTAVEYLVILARIALADPEVFVQMLGRLAGGEGGDQGSEDRLRACWRWLADEWFGSFDSMGNPEQQKVACLGLTRLCELPGPPMPELVLGRLQDYLSMWTSAVVEAQGDATQPDSFVWPAEGPVPAASEYDTPLMTAEAAFVSQDPLHTETTYTFVTLRLQDLVKRCGGEQAFEAEWAVNVDREVLQGFRNLTVPRQ